MKALSNKNADRLARTLTVSLVAAAFAGVTAPPTGVLAGESSAGIVLVERTVQDTRLAAEQGNPKAMYWLAMMHIEGSIEDADYDYGVDLLRSSARRGNKDAKRMYLFMDNAFSGEGC